MHSNGDVSAFSGLSINLVILHSASWGIIFLLCELIHSFRVFSVGIRCLSSDMKFCFLFLPLLVNNDYV